MELKPELISAFASLGLSEPELAVIRDRMVLAVESLEARINALNAQIGTLTAQRDEIASELAQANTTVAKLIV